MRIAASSATPRYELDAGHEQRHATDTTDDELRMRFRPYAQR
jgi:hypothetical protein